ncbi:MAG: SOS response-associated peptidase [Chloroflexi bacterium]|nr:SOS response-associated peptidase [Chloroflexota bacterium]
MCGRYGLPDDHPVMFQAFDIKTDPQRSVDWDALMPRYNIAPTDQVPVIFQRDGERIVTPMRWGLIPFRTAGMRGRTALDEKGKSINTPINARAETVHSNGIFKRSFERRRCVIPAGGFYEWKRVDGAKVPYWIYLSDERWMGFAGIYTWWKSPEGSWVASCTVITTSPNSFIEPIHDRMPVILTAGAYDMWLDPENEELAELKEVLVPYPSHEIQAHQVATLVNKVDNDGPELIEAV